MSIKRTQWKNPELAQLARQLENLIVPNVGVFCGSVRRWRGFARVTLQSYPAAALRAFDAASVEPELVPTAVDPLVSIRGISAGIREDERLRTAAAENQRR